MLHILHGYRDHPVSLEDFTTLRTTALAELVQLEALADEELENAIACSRIRAGAVIPPLAALTHAALPYRCILSAQPGSGAGDRLHAGRGEAVAGDLRRSGAVPALC